MTGNLAFVFPGQGSQYVGMGRDLFENFEVARRVFEEADDALGVRLSRVCFEGTADELQLTENTQPAILMVSIAALRSFQAEGGPEPAAVAGHSLGEYSALVAAGSLSLADAVRTVRARGRYMQEASPVGTGAMAAVLGSDLATIEEACREAADGEVCSPANINSPGQVVIAGSTGAVDRAVELLKGRGATRAIKLNVSAPFHCALMMPAQERLARDLNLVEFNDLRVPLITNVDAKEINTGADARASLIRQVSSPVKWLQTVELLISKGVNKVIEIGPGKVLSGLIRQVSREIDTQNVEDSATVKQAVGSGLAG